MRRKHLLAAGLIVLGLTWSVQAEIYDIVHGLYLNKPTVDSGSGTPGTGTIVQTGKDGWWYYTDPVGGGSGVKGAMTAAQMNPANYVLWTAGKDGVGDAYGFGTVSGAGGRPWVVNGTWDNGSGLPTQLTGAAEGTALNVNTENFNQIVMEWRAPSGGSHPLTDVAFQFDAITGSDMEWHIFKRVSGVSTELAYSAVLGAGADSAGVPPPVPLVATATTPVLLTALGLNLSPGDSIFLYGRVMDHDGGDGTGIRGTINYIPEPTAAMLLLAGAAFFGVRRRRN